MPTARATPHQPTQLDQSLVGKSQPEQVTLIVQELSRRLTPDSVAWVFALAQLADRNHLELPVVRRSASDLAWPARGIGQRIPDDSDWQKCAGASNPDSARRTLAYVHGCRLRLDFRFDQLAAATRRWLVEVPDDAFIQSLAAFAALGQGSDRAEPILGRVSTLPDLDSVCRATCLHGLWFGTHLPDQAERMLALSDEMIGHGEDEANLYYWRAFALRRLGRFEDAQASIDQAIALLPVGMNAVHQDYVRERELITTTWLLREQVTALTEQLGQQLREQFRQHREGMREEVDRHTTTARRIVSESLLGIVEVLALFVTLAGFLIGSGVLVFQAEDFGQSFAAVTLLMAGAVSFFLLLRVVVRFERAGSGRWPGLGRLARWLQLRDRQD
ncbi:MAG: tetratricopeptide repeat protein [Natronosporangium sp.]